jgi:hypothetical protein
MAASKSNKNLIWVEDTPSPRIYLTILSQPALGKKNKEPIAS